MQRIRVKSSNIKSIGYDVNTKVLEVEFNTGSIYQYSNVPKHEYDNLLSSTSKGRYMNTHIKEQYICVKVR